jgi:hypothetical protein
MATTAMTLLQKTHTMMAKTLITVIKQHPVYSKMRCGDLDIVDVIKTLGWNKIVKIETEEIDGDSDRKQLIKELRKQFPRPGFLPKNKNFCCALLKNKGCFSQCTKKPKNGLSLCTSCLVNKEKNDNKLRYGHIDERAATITKSVPSGIDEDGDPIMTSQTVTDYMAFVANNGDTPETYANVIGKDYDLTDKTQRDEVESKIEEAWGVTVSIPKNQWVRTTKTRSRKSSSSVKSGASATSVDPAEKMCRDAYMAAVTEHYKEKHDDNIIAIKQEIEKAKAHLKAKYEDMKIDAKQEADLANKGPITANKKALKKEKAEAIKSKKEEFAQACKEDGADVEELTKAHKKELEEIKAQFKFDVKNVAGLIDTTQSLKAISEKRSAESKKLTASQKEQIADSKRECDMLIKEAKSKYVPDTGMVFVPEDKTVEEDDKTVDEDDKTVDEDDDDKTVDEDDDDKTVDEDEAEIDEDEIDEIPDDFLGDMEEDEVTE